VALTAAAEPANRGEERRISERRGEEKRGEAPGERNGDGRWRLPGRRSRRLGQFHGVPARSQL
jgi:hypothetical protein